MFVKIRAMGYNNSLEVIAHSYSIRINMFYVDGFQPGDRVTSEFVRLQGVSPKTY